MVFEKIRDWQRYLENVMGVDFEIDGKNSIYNLLKKSPQTDEFDTKDVFTLEFFSAVLDDIDTLSESINEYPGDYSFSDPFDDLSNWVVISGNPFSGGKLVMTSGDEVSRLVTINGDRITIKMLSADVTQTPALQAFIEARAPGATISTQILEIKIDDSKLKYDNGSENDIQAVSNDTEYEVIIDFDFTNKTFIITVDTVEQVTDAAFETVTAEKIYQVRLVGHGSIDNSFSDDFEGDLSGWDGSSASIVSGECEFDQNEFITKIIQGYFYPTSIEVTMRKTSSALNCVPILIGKITPFNPRITIQITSDNIFSNGVDTGINTDNNSHTYRVEIDYTSSTYNLYYDEQLIDEGRVFTFDANYYQYYAVNYSSGDKMYLDDFSMIKVDKARFDDFKNEFVGSHPAVITPANCIYKDKHREKHWWTVVWEVWN